MGLGISECIADHLKHINLFPSEDFAEPLRLDRLFRHGEYLLNAIVLWRICWGPRVAEPQLVHQFRDRQTSVDGEVVHHEMDVVSPILASERLQELCELHPVD